MEIVASSFIALVAVALMVLRGPHRSIGVMLAVTPLGAAAAFNLPAVGGATIGVADLAVLSLFALVCLTPAGLPALVGTMRPFGPGFWMGCFAAFCVVSAMFFPRIFAGETEVFSISRSANSDGIVVNSLRPTTGNLTQLFRILLGACLFLAVATLMRRRPDPAKVVAAMALATGIHVGLGVLDTLTAAAGLPQALDPIRTANYAILSNHYVMGVKRMIGGFPEASAFGFYSLGLFGFWLAYWVMSPSSRLAPWMALLSLTVLLRSTSSSGYVAGIAFGGTWGLWMVVRHLRAEAGRRGLTFVAVAAFALWSAALAIFATYQLVTPVTEYLDRMLFDKLETESGVERMAWNAQAFKNFLDTGTFGAGLGSVRASNWLLASLGSIGAIGTGFFFALLGTLAAAPAPDRPDGARAVIGGLKAACLALFLSALLTGATPDLGLFFFLLAGLAAGLSRGAVLEARRDSATQHARSRPLALQ
ncbi:MAG: hypothetical protein AAGG09_16200 [Pseudomonadota bacterium]